MRDHLPTLPHDSVIALWDTLYDAFIDLPDPRLARTRAHPLIDIIAVAICAVICGADSWVAVETFGKAKRAWLEQYLGLPHGIPSHDTFGRVFAALDADQFQHQFRQWVTTIWPSPPDAVISLDGKTLRGSHDRGANQSAIHLVSAWAHEQRLVLAQQTVDTKSNEITAIPALLALLDLRGCTVTIDAIGCQVAIATQILQQQGEYVLAVKDNQETLHTDITTVFTTAERNGWSGIAHDQTRTVDAGHGRIEVREYWVITEPEELDYVNRNRVWPQVGGIGKVRRERTRDGVTSSDISYYLLNKAATAVRFAHTVRGHWGIENQVHWVLDVTFSEDQSRIRTGHGAQNFAVLRHIALNMLRHEPSRGSIKSKRFRAALDPDYLLKVLQH
jgi:predicted transposase YbfD/YdcC